MRRTAKLSPWLVGTIAVLGLAGAPAASHAATKHSTKTHAANAQTDDATTADGTKSDTGHGYNPPLSTASPAMWRIDNGTTRIYLLGSIHILPENLKWRTPVIDKAIESAGFFVYETEIDHTTLSEMVDYTALNGFLPAGKHLNQMLSPQGRKDLDAVLANLPITEEDIDGMQPWLAGMYVANSVNEKKTVKFGKGVDMQIMDYMNDHKKYDRYLETPREQMMAIAGEKPDEQLLNFEDGLHVRRSPYAALLHMVEMWRVGDIEGLAKVPETEFDDPDFRQTILDNRNKHWIPEIEDMLKEDHRTFFLTVGAGHMGGPHGVIALLCNDAWKVQRVQTGTAPVQADACHSGVVTVGQKTAEMPTTAAAAKTASAATATATATKPTTVALKR